MIRRLFTRPRTVTPQRFSGNACRICGNTFAMALPTHYGCVHQGGVRAGEVRRVVAE
jgi:hypothetical protein